MFGPRKPQTSRNKAAFRRPPKFRPVLRKFTELHVFSLQLNYTVEPIPDIHQKVHLVATVGSQDFRLPRQESSQGIYTWAAARGNEHMPMCTFTADSLRALSKGPPLVVDVYVTDFEGRVDRLSAVRCVRLGAFRLRLALLSHVEERVCINLESTGFEIDTYLPANRPKAPELLLEVAWSQQCDADYRPSKSELLAEQAGIARHNADVARAQLRAEEDAKARLIAQLRADKENAESRILEEVAKRKTAQDETEDANRKIQEARRRTTQVEEKLHDMLEQEAIRRIQYQHEVEQRRIAEERSRRLFVRSILDDLYHLIDVKEQDAQRLTEATEQMEFEKQQKEKAEAEKEKAEAELKAAQDRLVHVQEEQEAHAHDLEARIRAIEEETLKKLQESIDAIPHKPQQGGVVHVHNHHHHHQHTHRAVHHKHTHVDNHHHTHVQHVQQRHNHHHHHHNHEHQHHQHYHHQKSMVPEHQAHSTTQSKNKFSSNHSELHEERQKAETHHAAQATQAVEASVEDAIHQTPQWNEPASPELDHKSEAAQRKQQQLEKEQAVRSAHAARHAQNQKHAEKKAAEFKSGASEFKSENQDEP
eukprot:gnl/MRDRNA2_/MRDRNA2_95390_c0_seq1.p1 gnl/MRDRNA2_/MRDRNA2_95390_c0~~gnl/MRDRNA2_/MRDRNA2_95390_c0_seq1.p1  ORF type:complete len:590 (+),score=144.71 gnl/MRDRNA2_/MRDRNA2_95390_c0_seq1:151-1920(+)